MKDFFKYMLATMLAMVIMGFFAMVMSFVMLLSVAAAGEQKPVVDDGSVLRLSLSGTINERATDNPFAELFGNELLQEQGLDQMLCAIKAARDDDKIKGMYVEAGALSADFAVMQELRAAIADFAKQKPVVAYGDTYTGGAYYVASAAQKVYINPSGMLDWHGIASQPIFFKELLEKVGVKMQVFRVGTYKSAVEPYTNTEMSPANRAQVESYINDIWGGICREVAASRGLSVDTLNALADRYVALAEAEEYVKCGLVDSLTYADGLRAKLRELTGTEKVNLVEAAEMAKLYEPAVADDKVAVYYAYGSIVDEASTGLGAEEAEIVGEKVVKDLDKLMNDDAVKAVVLRINSGGGSAYASEQMWRAVQLLKQKKPVVVSMSGLAASGGYYMSCGADYIFADAMTLTGSIGIFGLVPDATGLLTEKLGLHFDVVKTNEASDFGALGRPFNEGEAAAMQAYVDRGYALFLKRVAEGRNMTVEAVDSIAQGRVWTGAQAVNLKLVDKLGGLDDAVAEAAKRAKIKDYEVAAHPAAPSWMDGLMQQVQDDYLENRLQSFLGEYYKPLMFVGTLDGRPSLQARIPYNPNFK